MTRCQRNDMMDTVCSNLQQLLRHVLFAKIGICAREIELVQVSSGKSTLEKIRNVAVDDRFKLKIPITDQYVTWEVVFNCSLPNCPPDFDLSDVDFFYSITLESMEEALPTLYNWDHRKDNALINVISELRSAYLKYQVEKLGTIDNRCAYEYSTLVNDSKVPPDHIEIFVDNSSVHLLIKLDVNLTSILPSDTEEYVLLIVRFGAHGSVHSANLITSRGILCNIGTNLELPHNIKGDESLCEYIDEATRSIEKQVLSVTSRRKDKRKQFIFELLKHQGCSIISYDTLEYNSASFLMEKNGFVCIIEVTFSYMFPQQQPRYRLISVYSTSLNQPLSQVVKTPFSENWEPSFMVDQAVAIIREKKLQEFQNFTAASMKQPK